MLFLRATRLLLGAVFASLTLPARAQTSVAAAPASELHCLMEPLDPGSRAERATLVVEGEVLDARGFWDEAHQHIYTAHRVRVYQVFKGTASTDITVITEGGTVDLEQHRLTNTLTLTPGQQGIFFLYPAPFGGVAASWAAYGSQQGFIQYDLSTATAQEPFRAYPAVDADFYQTVATATGQAPRLVQPNPALTAARQRVRTAARGLAPTINSIAPLSLTAGTGAVLTITGSGFGAARGAGYVEFRNADDGGGTFVRPLAGDYLSWTDTRIEVRVPSYGTTAAGDTGVPAGSGTVRVASAEQVVAASPTPLTIVYALSNVQPENATATIRPGHINQNNTGGYTFRFDPTFAANAAASQSWQRALASWRCQSGINWQVGEVRTARGVAADGENAVGFAQDTELPARVLGRTTSYYSGCRTGNGPVSFYVREIDMVFSNTIAWQFGPSLPTSQTYDFETVAVHELGHAQQLAHLILPAAVMHYAVRIGQVSRTLNPLSDIAGGRLVLRSRSFPAAVCGTAAMLPAPLATFTASGATVAWTTRDECFVQNFVVERAETDTTAAAWQTLGTVAAGAAGNSYVFTDTQAPAGLHYYRLRVRRPDATLDTTIPVITSGDLASINGLALYPNPVVSGPLQLLYNSSAAGTLRVYVYDAIGRYHQGQAFNVQAGLNVLSPLNVDNLRAGWYLVRWRDDAGQKGHTKFVRLTE